MLDHQQQKDRKKDSKTSSPYHTTWHYNSTFPSHITLGPNHPISLKRYPNPLSLNSTISLTYPPKDPSNALIKNQFSSHIFVSSL